MILTLAIDRIQPNVYRVATLVNAVEVTEATFHLSVEDAVREAAGNVPPGFAHYADVKYCGVSSGTIALSILPGRAPQVADQLMAVVADMHRISAA